MSFHLFLCLHFVKWRLVLSAWLDSGSAPLEAHFNGSLSFVSPVSGYTALGSLAFSDAKVLDSRPSGGRGVCQPLSSDFYPLMILACIAVKIAK